MQGQYMQYILVVGDLMKNDCDCYMYLKSVCEEEDAGLNIRL